MKLTTSCLLRALAIAGVMSASSAYADSLITFEELPGGLQAMGNSPGSAVPLASQLSNQYLATNGVTFSSGSGYAALVNHGAPTASMPNIIGGTSNGALDYNTAITIAFFDASNASLKGTTNTFKIQGDWEGLGFGSVFATAYDANGNVLATTSDTDDKPSGIAGPVLQFSVAGIHSVLISSDNGTVGFDQLEFGTVTAVPEPETFALLLAGLGLLGAVVGRRHAMTKQA